MKYSAILLTLSLLVSCSTTSEKKVADSGIKPSRGIASINKRFIANIEQEYTINKLDFNPLPYEYKHFVTCVKDNKDGTYMARFGYKNLELTTFNVSQGASNKLAPVHHVNKNYPVTEFKTGYVGNAFEIKSIAKENNVVWKLGRSLATASFKESKKCD